MAPIYLFAPDPASAGWIVSRVDFSGTEPLFACSTAWEAHALTRALRGLASGDIEAQRDAFRDLELHFGADDGDGPPQGAMLLPPGDSLPTVPPAAPV